MAAAFKPLNTKDDATAFQKTLLYSTHGWGKTTQAKHYKAAYGKGFIISGESGLSSIRSEGIDYLPFTSFDGRSEPANGVFSFTEICRMVMSDDFKKAGYRWIMLDSLTELSDMVFAWSETKAIADAAALGKKVNGFDTWGNYKEKMIGACKFIRDLPYHVCITALAKETQNDDGETEYWPMVQGNAVQSQIPGIFDNVFCGVSKTIKGVDAKDGNPATPDRTERYIVTAHVKGWRGKTRDEYQVVKPVEVSANVPEVLAKIKHAELEALAGQIKKVANGNATS